MNKINLEIISDGVNKTQVGLYIRREERIT